MCILYMMSRQPTLPRCLHPQPGAYRYATLLFFGGMAVTWCLNQLAHGLLHLAAASQAARKRRAGGGGGGGGGTCGGCCPAGLWLRGGGWGWRGAAAGVDVGKQVGGRCGKSC